MKRRNVMGRIGRIILIGYHALNWEGQEWITPIFFEQGSGGTPLYVQGIKDGFVDKLFESKIWYNDLGFRQTSGENVSIEFGGPAFYAFLTDDGTIFSCYHSELQEFIKKHKIREFKNLLTNKKSWYH
jgi:hypothetical protein